MLGTPRSGRTECERISLLCCQRRVRAGPRLALAYDLAASDDGLRDFEILPADANGVGIRALANAHLRSTVGLRPVEISGCSCLEKDDPIATIRPIDGNGPISITLPDNPKLATFHLSRRAAHARYATGRIKLCPGNERIGASLPAAFPRAAHIDGRFRPNNGRLGSAAPGFWNCENQARFHV